MAGRRTDPKTKEDFLDRMLSFDFDGDIRHLGVEPATIQRLGPNALRLKFPDSDQVFDLTVHKPREFAKVRAEKRTFNKDEQPSQEQGDEAKGRRGRQRGAVRTRRQRRGGEANA